MRIRIVLLPEKRLKEEALRYSAKIADSFSVDFRLDEGYWPHVTVFAAEFRDEDLEEVKRITGDLSKGQRKIQVKIKDLFFDPYNKTFISFIFDSDSQIIALRKQLINLLFDLIPNGLFFNYPHVTLAKFSSEEEMSRILEVAGKLPQEKFQLTGLAICPENEHGTINNFLAKFTLGD